MVRPVKSFDAILNAVVTELQRTQGAKVKLTLEIQAEAPNGFAEGEVGVVRDNARQLKFTANPLGSRIRYDVKRWARKIPNCAAVLKPITALLGSNPSRRQRTIRGTISSVPNNAALFMDAD